MNIGKMMQYLNTIPTTVFDNFLDHPDKVRDWALGLNYQPDLSGRWPGKRTPPLHQINPAFFDMMCKKFFSQFFDISNEQLRWQVSMFFQIIDRKFGSGWIHSDDQHIITGILYLNPNSNLNSGTSIFREKQNVVQYVDENQLIRKEGHLGNIDDYKVEQSRLDHNSQFEETIRFNNVYNRMVSFDSHLHHAAHDFFVNDEDPRLTLILFVNELQSTFSPVSRVRKTHF